MIKAITKIGNSRGIIFDSALLELAGLKEGDKLNVTVHEGGTITLVPDMEAIESGVAAAMAADLISTNSELFKRLSQ